MTLREGVNASPHRTRLGTSPVLRRPALLAMRAGRIVARLPGTAAIAVLAASSAIATTSSGTAATPAAIPAASAAPSTVLQEEAVRPVAPAAVEDTGPFRGPTATPPARTDVEASIAKGVAFLLRDQYPDGSFGSEKKPESGFWSNPESHRAWKVATTGLAVLALLEVGKSPEEKVALDRALDFLVANSEVKRPSNWDVDNVWAYVYALQALAEAHARLPEPAERRPKLRAAAETQIRLLEKYQAPNGGWAYYDFETLAQRPSWATSFTTAAAVVGLARAREDGLAMRETTIPRALEAVRRCRLPSGAYTYGVDAIPSPGGLEYINQVKGSLSRIQVGNYVLARWGEGVSLDDVRSGLEAFFRDHRFLDVARLRPIPHEAYYYNSGYFFLFGHYYAALAISLLPAAERARFHSLLQAELLRCQETDGSTWDFYMSSYGKPYGTSFAVLALARSLADGG